VEFVLKGCALEKKGRRRVGAVHLAAVYTHVAYRSGFAALLYSYSNNIVCVAQAVGIVDFVSSCAPAVTPLRSCCVGKATALCS
jgi:hypothetical protein